MELKAVRDIKDITIYMLQTYMLKIDTVNSIHFIYKDNKVYIKITTEVFNDDLIDLYKDVIKKTISKNEEKVIVKFKVDTVNIKGKKEEIYNVIRCSFGMPNETNILSLNCKEITELSYYFEVDNIDDLKL